MFRLPGPPARIAPHVCRRAGRDGRIRWQRTCRRSAPGAVRLGHNDRRADPREPDPGEPPASPSNARLMVATSDQVRSTPASFTGAADGAMRPTLLLRLTEAGSWRRDRHGATRDRARRARSVSGSNRESARRPSALSGFRGGRLAGLLPGKWGPFDRKRPILPRDRRRDEPGPTRGRGDPPSEASRSERRRLASAGLGWGARRARCSPPLGTSPCGGCGRGLEPSAWGRHSARPSAASGHWHRPRARSMSARVRSSSA